MLGEGSTLSGVWTGGRGGNQSDWIGDLDSLEEWDYIGCQTEIPCTSHTMTSTKTSIEPLEKLLSDSYTLYVNTPSSHWNVKWPIFTTLHNVFDAT